MPQHEFAPLPRCCPSHDDWRVLTEHLIADFPALPAGDVLRELAQAKAATGTFAVDEAQRLDVAELMARHQLLLLSGDTEDLARLDPEQHSRRPSTT